MILRHLTRVPLALLLALGCAGPVAKPAQRNLDASCCQTDREAAWRKSVVQTASGLVGEATVKVGGRTIGYDCAGVTRAIFLPVGVDLYHSAAAGGQANGVRLIYRHVRQHGRVHQGPAVRPGDLVFFHNTWDANGDGKLNDPLTHVGIVEAIETDGTLIFISRVAGAIERYRMNLMEPHRHRDKDGRVLNDYLRRKQAGDAGGTPYLAGELFTIFGTPILR